MIPPRNLSLLANRLAKGSSRRLPEAVLERDYCLAWFLVALSRTPLRERLAFKGGTAIKRCYIGDYRFSEDLDFTLATESTFDEIRRELAPVFAEAKRATGAVFRFAREDRRTHAQLGDRHPSLTKPRRPILARRGCGSRARPSPWPLRRDFGGAEIHAGRATNQRGHDDLIEIGVRLEADHRQEAIAVRRAAATFW